MFTPQQLLAGLFIGGTVWLLSRQADAADKEDEGKGTGYLDPDDDPMEPSGTDEPKQATVVLPALPAPAPIPAVPSGGNPPNHSGDPAGYDTNMFAKPLDVRKILNGLGYEMALIDAPPPAALVGMFQEDFNNSVANGFMGLTGSLAVDQVPGKNTLNAMRFAAFGANGPDPSDVLRWTQWRNEHGLWG